MWRRARVRVASLLVGGGVGIAAAVQNRSTKPISTSVPSRTWNAMVSDRGSVSSSPAAGRGASTIGKPYAGKTFSLRQMSTSSTRHMQTPVLIVGAGPVGTYLSLLLSRFGVPNILVDRGERGGDHGLGDKGDAHPRAHVLHTRTMELMREIGVDGELFEAMPPSEQWRKFIYCTSLLGEDIASIDHFNCGDGLYENLTESSPTHLAHLSQPVLERVLSREAKNWASKAVGRSPDGSSSTPCNLLVRTEVSSVREEGSAIVASLVQTDVGGGKHSVEVTADYIVGCDGARSSVRACAGIGVSGRRGIEHFMSVHFRCPGLWERMRGRGGMLYFIFNEGVVACLVAHDLEKGEWVAQLPFFPDVHPAGLSASTVMKQVAACIGGSGGDPPEFTIVSSKAWSMDGAVADTFQKGRVFLAGDAAHQFPPSGGFGLNTGLQDAHNLAWKLACVVGSAAPDALLSTYTLERKPVAHANSNLSIENHRRGLIGMQATGLKREWLDQTAEAINSVPLLPSWAKAQALEMAVGAGMAPFTLLQKGEKSLVATLVGVPWSRAMRQAVEEGRCLPLLFPLHDLGVTYPSSASIFGAAAPPGGATPGEKYSPSDTPSDEKYYPSGAAGCRIPHARLEALGVGTLGDKEDFSSLDLVREGMREGRAPLHVLIVFGGAEDASRWTSLSPGQDFSKRVVVVRIVVERDAELRGAAGAGGNGGEDGVVYVDKRGGFASACGVERGGALLVRPDGHIAWRSRGFYVEGGEEAAALERWFGSGGF